LRAKLGVAGGASREDQGRQEGEEEEEEKGGRVSRSEGWRSCLVVAEDLDVILWGVREDARSEAQPPRSRALKRNELAGHDDMHVAMLRVVGSPQLRVC
jgi:hypothetical protein